jgi:hypothetical protein
VFYSLSFSFFFFFYLLDIKKFIQNQKKILFIMNSNNYLYAYIHTYINKINNSIMSFFFYAIFRFVATHCCTPVFFSMCIFFKNHFFSFSQSIVLYLYVYMFSSSSFFFLSVFLFICNDMLFVLSMV